MTEKEKLIQELEQSIQKELEHLSDRMTKKIPNETKYFYQLKSRLSFLEWANRKLDLYNTPLPKLVKQREIFYCELGQNIGSEQDGKRPVVILQNNVGNAHAKITLIAPITSFGAGKLRKKNGQLYRVESEGDWKRLNFYDIPIQLEENSKYKIHGVINVSQIRVVSKNRLAQTPVAMITEDCFHQIVDAIDKNISIFENHPIDTP